MLPFDRGTVYIRQHLHDEYGGQRYGGISTPSHYPMVWIFTGDAGEQYGYTDRWTTDGTFLYTGEGQSGDMEFVRGNKAVRDHVSDGKDLLLFEYVASGRVKFVEQMIFVDHHIEQLPDQSGSIRQAIVCELAPVELVSPVRPRGEGVETPRQVTIGETNPEVTRAIRRVYLRCASVREHALARAAGTCEMCNTPAPFQTKEGTPYLEVHHIRRLTDGGPDLPEWVAALCPTCHREIHHGQNGEIANEQLSAVIRRKEAS